MVIEHHKNIILRIALSETNHPMLSTVVWKFHVIYGGSMRWTECDKQARSTSQLIPVDSGNCHLLIDEMLIL